MIKRLYPMKAINELCLWCMGGGKDKAGRRGEVRERIRECSEPNCALYDYREGKKSPEAEKTPLKAMRQFCVDCVGGQSYQDVVDCSESEKCTLYPYRLGKKDYIKHPNQVGVPFGKRRAGSHEET